MNAQNNPPRRFDFDLEPPPTFFSALVAAATALAGVDLEIIAAVARVPLDRLEEAVELGSDILTPDDKGALRGYFSELGIYIVTTDAMIGVLDFRGAHLLTQRRPFREVASFLLGGGVDPWGGPTLEQLGLAHDE